MVSETNDFFYFVFQDHEQTKTSVCTFLSVLIHFSVIIPQIKEKVQPHTLSL